MRKIFCCLSVICLIFIVLSCTKEDVPVMAGSTMSIYASTESGPGTRTSLAGDDSEGYDVVWTEGDEITIGGKPFTLAEGANTTCGRFEGPVLPDGEYTALYATEFMNYVPLDQVVRAGGLISHVPMQASLVVKDGVASDMSFKNLGGLLRLDIKGSGTVKGIRIKASTGISTTNCNLDCGDGMAVPGTFYVCMRPGTYGGNGKVFSIEVSDFDGHTCTKTLKSKAVTITRSYITRASVTVDGIYIKDSYRGVSMEEYGYASESETAGWYGRTAVGQFATRAVIDDSRSALSWTKGDTIWLAKQHFVAMQDGECTDFRKVFPNATLIAPFVAYYPNCRLKATLPGNVTETWREGIFNMPVYAPANTKELAFKNTCGVLRVCVKSSDFKKVRSINLTSWDRALSGVYYVDGDKAVLSNPSDVGNMFTVNYTEDVPVSSEGTMFYLPVPAQTYRELKVTISDGTHSKKMTTLEGKDITISRNVIYPVTFIADAPDITGYEYVLDNCNVRLVQLWEGGPKWATVNVGVTDSDPYKMGDIYFWGGIYNNDQHTERYNKGSIRLEGTDDTATYRWGSRWRMPSKEEMEALVMNCNCNYLPGTYWDMEFTGKGAYSGKKLIFPSPGYWTSDPESESRGHCMMISGEAEIKTQYRWTLLCVRAVLNE